MGTSTRMRTIDKYRDCSRFRLTFAYPTRKLAAESFRAGLRRSYLSRRPVAGQPISFQESLRLNAVYISPTTFRVTAHSRPPVQGNELSISQKQGLCIRNRGSRASVFSGQRSASRCGVGGEFAFASLLPLRPGPNLKRSQRSLKVRRVQAGDCKRATSEGKWCL